VDMYFLGLDLHRVQKSVSFRIELIFVFSFYFIPSISIDLVIVSFRLPSIAYTEVFPDP